MGTRPGVKFFVETFIAWDRPGQPITEEWIEWRASLFRRLTFESLRAQSFKEFAVIIQSGSLHRALMERLDWPSGSLLAFDRGREVYGRAAREADYISITRIDSDDLFHREAMASVAQAVRAYLVGHSRTPQPRTVFTFRDKIVWDMVNDFIAPHERSSSPFFTHLFPSETVRRFDAFADLHFRGHGSGGAGDRQGLPLPAGMVCVVKHGRNHSVLKRGLAYPVWTPEQRLAMAASNESIIIDKAKIATILASFGVNETALEPGIYSQDRLRKQIEAQLGERII